jgi:hypothetical protein
MHLFGDLKFTLTCKNLVRDRWFCLLIFLLKLLTSSIYYFSLCEIQSNKFNIPQHCIFILLLDIAFN